MPFLFYLIQSTKQKTASAKLLLDHRERSFTWMTTTRVFFLGRIRRHLFRMRDAERFVVLSANRPPLRLALNAHRQKRTLRTIVRGSLVMATGANSTAAFLPMGRVPVRQTLALRTPVAIFLLVVNECLLIELFVTFRRRVCLAWSEDAHDPWQQPSASDRRAMPGCLPWLGRLPENRDRFHARHTPPDSRP
jgi:hypothetical protein